MASIYPLYLTYTSPDVVPGSYVTHGLAQLQLSLEKFPVFTSSYPE